jgi:hypothetical protein
MTFTATLSAASGGSDRRLCDGGRHRHRTCRLHRVRRDAHVQPRVITRTFTVPVVGDTRDEFDETFVANLASR